MVEFSKQMLCHLNNYLINIIYVTDTIYFQGFGHLLPSAESGPILGVIYDSCSFPQHNRPDGDTTRLTVRILNHFHSITVAVTYIMYRYRYSLDVKCA